jgi:hypothetical protein
MWGTRLFLSAVGGYPFFTILVVILSRYGGYPGFPTLTVGEVSDPEVFEFHVALASGV